MTSLTHPAPLAAPSGSLSRRLPLLIFAIGVAPYLCLKLLWLTGHHYGIVDPAWADSPFLWVANLVTFGMDAFAAALVAVMSSGRVRPPAWLLLVPMWVATGLLMPILLSEPLSLLLELVVPAPAPHAIPLAPWVFTLVYVGFCVQAVALIAAFAVHVRGRWPEVARGLGRRSDSPVEAVIRPVLMLGAALAVVAAVLHLASAVGHPVTAGLPDYVNATLAVGAAAAAVWLGRGRTARPSAAQLLGVWACPASLFAWGLWLLAGLIAGGAGGSLTAGAAHTLEATTAVVKLMAGLVIGLCSLVLAPTRALAADPATDPEGGLLD